MSKTDRLKRILTSSGKLSIAAIDHRGLLKTMLHPENPESTREEEITEWKGLMAKLYGGLVSSLLIDPTYGAKVVDTSFKCGWMMSMEKTGYRGGQEARVTELIPNWSVKDAKELGASAVKLLLYYDPENKELARKQRELAIKLGDECEREGMVYLLEPLSYRKSSDPYLVERMVDELLEVNVDIFKLEYPGDIGRCQRVSDKLNKLGKPWVLLSAGADYETYKRELVIACDSGAAGMAVGRAAWQEFGTFEPEKREKFLREVAVERIKELVKIVEQHARKIEL